MHDTQARQLLLLPVACALALALALILAPALTPAPAHAAHPSLTSEPDGGFSMGDPDDGEHKVPVPVKPGETPPAPVGQTEVLSALPASPARAAAWSACPSRERPAWPAVVWVSFWAVFFHR